MELSGRTVLLTGASGGLGRAIARQLAAEGAKLIITGRNEDALHEVAAATGAEVVIADLSNSDDLDRLIEVQQGVDVLIANAGVGSPLSIVEETRDNVDFVVDTNLRAPMQLATAFVQHKLSVGPDSATSHPRIGCDSHIAFVGSLSGLAATPNTTLYNATKFGLRGYALALRQDLHAHGIGVSIIEPGFIRDAGMFAASGTELPAGVRTKSPHDVAVATTRAIRDNAGEVFVAPIELRAAATFAVVAPGLSAAVQRRLDTAAMNSH